MILKLRYFLFAILSFVFINCEKDDICDPSLTVTPHLIIEFYDNILTSSLKNVRDLKVFDIENQNFLVINQTANGEERFVFTGNKLKLPLNTLQNISRYNFIFNGNNNPQIPQNINTDRLTFNYNLNYIYVSRGCGYKAVFNNLLPINLVDESNDGLWITSVQLVNNNIINEDVTHVKIYF